MSICMFTTPTIGTLIRRKYRMRNRIRIRTIMSGWSIPIRMLRIHIIAIPIAKIPATPTEIGPQAVMAMR